MLVFPGKKPAIVQDGTLGPLCGTAECEQVHEPYLGVFSYSYVWTFLLKSVVMMQAVSEESTGSLWLLFLFSLYAEPSHLCFTVFFHNHLIFNPSALSWTVADGP